MNPKPLVGLNHFTVPLAIASSPRDQKNNSELPVPANRPCPRRARYAVWGTLDSLNGIGISAENSHYRGAFGHFACSATICSGRADGKTKPAAILLNRKHRRYAQGSDRARFRF